MLPLDRLLTFAAVTLVVLVIPGPSVLFVIGRAVALGRRAGLATVAGNATGAYLQVTAVALGAAGHVPLQLLTLGLVVIAIGLLSDSAWAVVAGTARNWFARSPRRLASVGGTGGLLMIGLGVRLALTGRRD